MSFETDASIDFDFVLDRLGTIDASTIAAEVNETGYVLLPKLLNLELCQFCIGLYSQEKLFRRSVVMQRHGFGQGDYQYFARPLPPLIATLQRDLYPLLVPTANAWQAALGIDYRYPENYSRYVEDCVLTGQAEPTPLLLRYGPGDYNRLHQDLYGETIFPLQLTILLSAPDTDFRGGEFVLTEQRPRMQSRADVVPLSLGDGVIFPTSQRPVRGTRGHFRVNIRHGVSRLHSGQRFAAGIIFHQAAK